MEDLKRLPIETLVDMLATYTAEFTHMRKSGGAREDYDKCKLLITLLTEEIAFRKQQEDDTLPGV